VTRSYAGVRYRRRATHGHVESYFLKANDPEGRRALWLKATIFAPDRAPQSAVAEAWAVAFDRAEGHVAVKTSVPYEAARFSKDDLDIAIDGSTYTRTKWQGSVATGERSIAWDVGVSDGGAPLVHFPFDWMYEASFPSSKLVALVPDARASGEITVNGKTWSLAGWPMTIGHNWGRRHTPSYAWSHCNAWTGAASPPPPRAGLPEPSLMFEGFSARIALGPVLSPPSTFLFVREGGQQWARRGFLGGGGIEEHMTLRRYSFRSSRGEAKLEGEVWAETDDFVGLYYANPDGTMVHCLNTKLASAELVLTLPRRGERLFRTRAAALEIATTNPHHGVRMYV
jgi:hypothetical protein